MQITTLLGSARKKGNTATVLGWVEEELITLGHSVERIYLNSKTIGGCLGCGTCKENPDEIACVQKDDAIDIFDRIADFLKAPKGGELYVGGCSLPAELPESAKDQAVDLARSLAG